MRPTVEDRGVLRFITAGSVDDGKSTLIGRLLLDSAAILAGPARRRRARVAAPRRGEIDLSLLTDGLEAEREQGITIDVAYRYFATPRRKFIIADAPGHEQYTRNMVTGASTADAAVLLVDATQAASCAQTRRHLLLARLLGMRHAIVFVNKMDLVGYARAIFERVRERARAPSPRRWASRRCDVIPGSALRGDMVVERGDALDWYDGPTLLERLESLRRRRRAARPPARSASRCSSCRRPQPASRARYMGRIESGHVLGRRRGRCRCPRAARTRVRRDPRRTAPSATRGRRRFGHAGARRRHRPCARRPASPTRLRPPREARSLEAHAGLARRRAAAPGGRYLAAAGFTARSSRAQPVSEHVSTSTALREIPFEGEVSAERHRHARPALQAPFFADATKRCAATGALILIDEATNHTVGAALVK